MSLDRVLRIQKNIKEKENLLYKDIYKKIEQKIDSHAMMGYRGCVYKVPRIVFGYPMFDLKKTVDILFDKLTENGFTVFKLNEEDLFITWYKAAIEAEQTEKESKISLENDNLSDLAITLARLKNRKN